MTSDRSKDDIHPLAAWGWDASFARDFAALAAAGLAPARVIVQHRDQFTVVGEGGEARAILSGKARREGMPAVGDWVAVHHEADGTCVIEHVVPRRSAFVRRAAGSAAVAQVAAANVDVAVIVAALPSDVNARRLERYVALAWESGAQPIIVLTKCDLVAGAELEVAAAAAVAPGVPVIALSAYTGDGIDELRRHLVAGRTAVLLGSSGAGKSTLVNTLAGDHRLATAAVRDSDGKGRHTTTHREMVRLPWGALLIDTPGMRELQLWHADDGVDATFADVTELALACRFGDCAHRSEPGCAVRAAVADGTLDAERLESWHKLRRELASLAVRSDPALGAAERARIKTLTRSMRDRLKEKGQ